MWDEALTMLDSHGVAYADGTAIPKRYVICFGSHSIGMGHNDPNLPGFQVKLTGLTPGTSYEYNPVQGANAALEF